MNRKILCPIIGLFGLLMSYTANADVFNLEDVAQKAQILSQKPYQEQVLNLPKELADMDYDAFRSLRYVREEGPWYKKNIPFELQFFHMGSIFKNSVKVHQIVAGETLYIPRVMLKADEEIFLDNITLEEIQKRMNIEVVPCLNSGKDFIDKILK